MFHRQVEGFGCAVFKVKKWRVFEERILYIFRTSGLNFSFSRTLFLFLFPSHHCFIMQGVVRLSVWVYLWAVYTLDSLSNPHSSSLCNEFVKHKVSSLEIVTKYKTFTSLQNVQALWWLVGIVCIMHTIVHFDARKMNGKGSLHEWCFAKLFNITWLINDL